MIEVNFKPCGAVGSVNVIRRSTATRIIMARRGAGTILQMIRTILSPTEITTTTGVGRGNITKSREGMTGTGTGRMNTERDIALLQGVGVDHLHGPAKAPIPLFVAGEVTMTETSARINDQCT